MKLQDLDAQRPTKQIAKTLKTYFGDNLNFDCLSEDRAMSMLQRVQSLLKEYKTSVSRHYSEQNPDYLKLIMLEQALSETVFRKQHTQSVITESEVQQAQVVMAAQDLVDRLQDMMEEVSEMQFKNVPSVTDAVKNEIGTEQASQFQGQASAALANLLAAVQAAKTEMENAQGVLTGQAPMVPGADAMPSAEPAPAPGEEMDLSLDANLSADEEEPEAGDSDLGRERR